MNAAGGAMEACVRVVGRRFPSLSAPVRDDVGALAAEIRAAEPGIGDIGPFGPNVFKGCGPHPRILFGDSGEIPLLAEASYNRIEYRIGFLAGEGDLVVIGDARNPAFEDYQGRVLGLAWLHYMNVATRFRGRYRATPATCLRDERAYERLRDFSAGNGGATLFAFLTSGTIWALAAKLAADTGCRMGVAGPPPLLARRTNNKIWFGGVVTRLFGTSAAPRKRTAQNWSTLVRHAGELARKWERLVIKLPDSAGSAGNCVVDCRAVRGLRTRELSDHLRRLLPAPMRGAPFPVAIEVWDANVLTSPSVQVWIPDPADGEPVIEGIFEQILIGPESEFAGATMADLPEEQDALLAEQALALALLFQKLGYFGRCSFDAVIAEPSANTAQLHWIECNARWGGVSIPMSFANRTARDDCFAVVQCGTSPLMARPFEQAVRIAEAAAPGGDVVLLSPNIVEAGTGSHFMAFGETPGKALARVRRVLRRLQDSA